ncbi:uncharacterized protein LOC143055700 [Mytilus galloprovincialis]|uniref:uncharacterized protein LOC143055700 n=1 Tax=Mytilus galloprovincialis TaxID=29158 RepID=UPI003F7C23FF
MSKKADDDKPEDKQETYIQMQSTFTDDVVPIEIKLMSDKKSVPLYLNLLESGFEEKRDIRLVIVGKKGSGKTSLVKRLFGVDKSEIPEVTSTNGIEIHRIRCDANTDAGIWNILDGNIKETDLNERLIQSFDKTLKSQGEEGVDRAVKEGGPWAPPVATKPLVTSRIVYGDADFGDDDFSDDDANEDEEPFLVSYDLQPNLLLEQTYRDIQTMLKSKVHSYNKNDFATLLLWDFAGDEEFYHTHQTFLSPYSIYLVVAKLNEAQDKEAQDLFKLWMDSIHCYSRLEDDKYSSDDSKTTPDDLDPPVVIVGTWKDAVTSESGKIKTSCKENILKYTKNMTEDELRHVRHDVFISNTTDDDSVFQPIRQYILSLARQMRTWNTKYPLKFIQLEKCLQQRKKELPIITFQELKQISTKTTKPLNNEELILFLKFHHEIRALVFFEDLPDYIILDTQWLSDAFKSIVTAKGFQSVSIKNQKRWYDFHSKGKLHRLVLEDLLDEKENILLKNNMDHILNVMEKFDIIIRPTKSDWHSAVENACYYVPCMIKAKPKCDIYELFNVTDYNCKKSTWFCFEFRFLPPNLMNHLIASLCRKYELAEVGVTKQVIGQNTEQAERVIALFKGVAVFELQETTKLSKLLVTTRPNSIQIQIWEFAESASIKRGMYKPIVDFVTDEINKIIRTRFKMTNVSFEKRWECGLTKPDSVEGSNKFGKKKITEYYCVPCTSTHKCNGEWLDTESEEPFDVYQKKPGQKGLVLIVNFLFSGKPNERQGSEIDVKNLTVFFRDELEYQVECQSDMTKTDLQIYLQNFEKDNLTQNANAYHSFICVVMSHGDENGIQTLDESKRITVKEIQRPFKNKPDGKFNGKPKLFLVQACRGQQKQEKVIVPDCTKSETQITKHESFDENYHILSVLYTRTQDGPSGSSPDQFCSDATEVLQKLPIDADVIVAYATTPDYISIRHTYKGAYFIRAFLSVAKKHYKEADIEDILRKVRNELATNLEYEPEFGVLAGKCQMAMLESTSTKKFFL